MEMTPRSDSAWFAPLAVLLLVLHGAFVLVDPAGWVSDPGVGWHLKSGEILVETQRLPVEDLFSFTQPGKEWINYQWGFHVFLGLLDKCGGLSSVVALCSLLYVLPVLWTLRRMLAEGAGPVAALLLAMAVWAVMMQHTYARPHLFTYLFFAAYLGILHRAWEGAEQSWRGLLWIPGLMLLWCNLHGGFTAGLALLGLYTGAAVLEVCNRPSASVDTRKRALWWAALFTTTVLASLANPYGWRLHLHILEFLFGSGGRRTHEFLPVWQHSSASVVVFWILVAAWVTALLRGRRSFSWAEQISGVFFLVYAVSAVRHIVLFALLSAPLIARIFAGRPLPWPWPSPPWGRPGAWAIGALVVLVWMTMPFWHPRDWPSDLVGLNLGPKSAAVLDARVAELVPVFNSDRVGGALIQRYHPGLRVFMDDRTDFYDGTFIEEVYLATQDAREGWPGTLDRYGIRGVVLKTGTALGRELRLRADWRLLAEDPQSEVFGRIGPVP
ncbi:MAG: hypothetical protein SFU85_07925 [Candidatus Methylacidiphilales bacterium]|nr:hypothetical protein [Candidatus Methylacidiphilales bacterium]